MVEFRSERDPMFKSANGLTILLLGVCLLAPSFGEDSAETPPRPRVLPTDESAEPSKYETDGEAGENGVKTLGGRQFWGDVAFFRGWRIQKNVFTGHHRLIGPKDERHAWGSLGECRKELNANKERLDLQPMSGRAVILIHGIGRSSKSFNAMKLALEADGVTVVGFDYASTRVPISDSAEYLNQVIESLEGIEQIDFVVHSMGGLVVRAWTHKHSDPRIGRLVMLGVPNLGAKMANHLKDVGLFKLVMGPAGQQLVEGDDAFVAGLPTPHFPFAVIAGARGTENGFNPLTPGDDDGTVSVDSTRLAGAADFMTVPTLHSFLMGNKDVIAASRRFLTTGVLRETGACEPILPAKLQAAP
jgi:pimeloyl-ACP methyl ester carboxylesterase